MAKRNTNRRRAAFAAIGLLVETGCGVFTLFLASRDASYSQALSGVLFAVRCFLDPSIPMNEGCYNALDFVLPRGSLVNPNPPAACGGRIVVVTAIMEAIVEASTLRLRPILMTTAAMVLGAIPLALATGAGAESRQAIGWVVVGGLVLGTLLTLFVIPTIYSVLARSVHKPYLEEDLATLPPAAAAVEQAH